MAVPSLAGAGWSLFPLLAAQGEANALGDTEGADGIEFLRAKMHFKIFSCIHCSGIVCLKRNGLEQRKKEGFCCFGCRDSVC